jgi:hypothetical protein
MPQIELIPDELLRDLIRKMKSAIRNGDKKAIAACYEKWTGCPFDEYDFTTALLDEYDAIASQAYDIVYG